MSRPINYARIFYERENKVSNSIKKFAAFALFFISIINPAHAYIDPNAGGIFMQVLTPILGIIFFGWRWIVNFFQKILRKILGCKLP